MAPKPTLLMLPPQTATTRAWAARLGTALPELSIVVAEDDAAASKEIAGADAAFGTLPADLVAQAGRLRWLQAPQAAPPAGFYSQALIAHPAVVTNFREIFNDHSAPTSWRFVLAFARGLQDYSPRQLRREWRRERPTPGDPLPRGERCFSWVWGRIVRRAARLAAAFGMRVIGVDATPSRGHRPAWPSSMAPTRSTRLFAAADFVVLTVRAYAGDGGLMNRARFSA